MPKKGKSKGGSRRAARPQRQQSQQSSGGGSSGSGLGKTLVGAGAGLADMLLPGSGSVVRGIGKIFGLGAYTRAGAETWLASNVPSMHATMDRGVRICHHEYLGEVTSSTAFALYSYAINPGLSKTFPWLSTLSSAFQKWEDHGIVLYFKSTSAQALNSTNTALGTVMGAVTYNPYQAAPVDKVMMLGLAGVQTGKPAEDNLFPVECKMSQSLFGTKLVRTGGVGDDLAKYDAGNFHLASVGSQATATIGELHIVYDITLKEPKLGASGWCAHYKSTTYTNALPLNGSAKIMDNIGCTVAGTTLAFPSSVLSPSAKYLVTLTWGGTSVTAVAPSITLNNLTSPNLYGGGAPSAYAGAGAASGAFIHQQVVAVTDPRLDATIVIGSAGTLPGAGVLDVVVCEVDSTLS